MDLIFEFIIWIFKALTGEGETSRKTPGQTPNASKKTTTPPVTTQRGPYNYGDGRQTPQSPVAKQRTLEEILEDVKRMQAQGKVNVPRPNTGSTPAKRDVTPPVPEKVKTPSLSRPLSEVQQPTEARATKPSPLPSNQGGAITSKLETRTLAQTLDQKEIVKPGLEKKFDNISERESQQAQSIGRTKLVAEVNTVSTMGEVKAVDSMVSSLTEKKTNSYADIFKAMRAAPPKTRAEMARQAFVFGEVFGPPRSQRSLQRK